MLALGKIINADTDCTCILRAQALSSGKKCHGAAFAAHPEIQPCQPCSHIKLLHNKQCNAEKISPKCTATHTEQTTNTWITVIWQAIPQNY